MKVSESHNDSIVLEIALAAPDRPVAAISGHGVKGLPASLAPDRTPAHDTTQ
ncbi:MAG: hypothetical protein KDC18_16855 [Alphaproteobacteria bacterium]|nr:hypothetical protein [Alphaproteobacteria bacterium]MCB9930370.1 hypothetical protein [Alphaproteobacteria bacterium]